MAGVAGMKRASRRKTEGEGTKESAGLYRWERREQGFVRVVTTVEGVMEQKKM